MAKSPTQTATDNDVAQDAQTELKRRARRRLIGATALALLAVVVLPMVMDHEPRPPSLDIQVRIPSQDSGLAGSGTVGALAQRILPGKGPTPLPPVTESRTAVPAAPMAAEAKAEPGPSPQAESKPAAVEAKPVPAPKPDAKPVATKPAAKPADKAKAADGARAEAALSGSSAPAAQWEVQLGAYRDASNVKVLLAKLKDMGVPTFTEKYESPQGPRTRVRAGPFATKEAAEKAQARAKAIGVNGPIAPLAAK